MTTSNFFYKNHNTAPLNKLIVFLQVPLFFIVTAMFSYSNVTAQNSFEFKIVNSSEIYPDSNLYWTIVCQNRMGKYCYMNPNGSLVEMDTIDNKTAVGTAKNCNDQNLFANYSTRLSDFSTIKVQDTSFINSAILYLSVDGFLPLCIREDTLQNITYAPPSFSNPSLQGYDLIFQAVEFAFNIRGLNTLNINTTNVDEVGMNINLSLVDSTGSTTVGFNVGRNDLIDSFNNCIDTNFQKLIIQSNDGKETLRILSPEHVTDGLGLDENTVSYFQNFYTNYIDKAWKFYEGKKLTIVVNDQSFNGSMKNGIFTFTPANQKDTSGSFTFTIPNSSEVMSANGQFISGSVDKQNVGKYIAAAIFRTVFMELPTDQSNSWCGDAMKAKYFTTQPINYYPAILHASSIKNLCYAYGYSDVCSESPSLASTTTESVILTIKD